ncbi:unnamed protein product [Closterium sp. NIES-54]
MDPVRPACPLAVPVVIIRYVCTVTLIVVSDWQHEESPTQGRQVQEERTQEEKAKGHGFPCPCGTPSHTQSHCFARLSDTWRTVFGDDAELPDWVELLRQRVDIYALDYDAILTAMYALPTSADRAGHLCVPPDPGIGPAALATGEAAALGASESPAPGTGAAAALGASESASSGAGEAAL